MRISGYGSSAGQQNQDRARNFRRGHRPGQKVRGLVLRRLKNGLALVRIDGQELVASIQTAPPPGVELFFLVERLDPEIVLKALSWHEASEGSDIAALAQSIRSSRDRLAALANGLSGAIEERQQAYARRILESPGGLEAFLEAETLLRQVNRSLSGMAEFLHLPWLLPQARDLEIARLGSPQEHGQAGDQEPGIEAWALSCLLPHAGRLELRLFLRPPLARFKLFLERLELAGIAERLLLSIGESLRPLELESLGVFPLPPGYPGVLQSVLASRRSTGFFALV